MKKILFILLIIILVMIIYYFLKDRKVYYLSINDRYGTSDTVYYNYENYIINYLEEKDELEYSYLLSNSDYGINDIINFIKDNDKFDDKHIKNLLIKSDLITLNIGYNDIVRILDKYDSDELEKIINEYTNNLEKLMILLRKYCKENIVMIGYYNIYENQKYDNNIRYLNRIIEELCKKYNINYINIEELTLYSDNTHPSIEGEHIIFNKIRKIMDRNVLK